jgi:hypothetical protein
MKKVLFSILLVTFIVAGIANQASAMGRKGHSSGNSGRHQGGSNSGSQSHHENGSSSQGGQGSSEETFGGNQNNDGNSGNPNDDSPNNNPPNNNHVGFYQDNNPGDEKFPAATPVPEPATLSLLGMGLAAVLLKQRKH